MMNPNESSHLNSDEIKGQVLQRMKATNDAFASFIKENLIVFSTKKLEIRELLEQDKIKYRAAYEERHQHDEDLKSIEETDEQIRSYMASPEYSKATLEQMLGKTVEAHFEENRKLKEDFEAMDKAIDHLQEDIDKTNYFLQKFDEMEDGMLALFVDEKRLDWEKISRSFLAMQKLFALDRIPEEDLND